MKKFITASCLLLLAFNLFACVMPMTQGETLHWAIADEDLETLQELIDKGLDVNAIFSFEDKEQQPLLYACNIDKLRSAEFLINNGADVNIKIDGFYPALIYVCINILIKPVNFELVKLLVENGADVNATASGELSGIASPLVSLLRFGEYRVRLGSPSNIEEVFFYLVDNGADIHFLEAKLFLYSSYIGYETIFEYLLENEANINAKDIGNNSQTAVVILANEILRNVGNETEQKYFTGGIKRLLENGADPTIPDDLGKTAFDYAEESEYQELIELLEEWEQKSI